MVNITIDKSTKKALSIIKTICECSSYDETIVYLLVRKDKVKDILAEEYLKDEDFLQKLRLLGGKING